MMKEFADRVSWGGGPRAPQTRFHVLVQGELQMQRTLGTFRTALAELENPSAGETS